MKYYREILIVLLSTIIIIVIVRENYDRRLIRKITGISHPSKLVHRNLDRLYSNNIYNSDIIFLGNSITEGVDWNELLGLNVSNQGVGGNTTKQILKRIDNVIREKPKYVFIMSGINDIYKGVAIEEIYKTYIEIIEVLLNHNIQPIIQSTLFVTHNEIYYKNINNQVFLLNNKLLEFCEKNLVAFIDINKSLSKENKLISEISKDGVHLNSKGYELWYKELIPMLFNLGYYKNLSGELD